MAEKLAEALYYKKLHDNKVQCVLCPHNCLLSDEQIGICKVRKNKRGILYTLNYGKVTSGGIDPIEKKPLYHFYPGKNIFSIGSFGCNLKCSFCQNYEIAHEFTEYGEANSDGIVNIVSNQRNNIGIAYTYNEPSIWYEFVLETAKKVKEKGYKNVLVTNGYINEEPLKELLPYIDGMNIDLKSFNKDFYKDVCGGGVGKVLENIKIANEHCLVEIATLLIEGLNTGEDEIRKLSSWIASVDKNIPLHLNRYYPAYKMNLPPTSVDKIYELRDEAKKYLNYVYVGNVMGADRNTYCPKCHTTIVDRKGFAKIMNLEKGKCTKCGTRINFLC